MNVLAPNLIVGSFRMSEILAHPGPPAPCICMAGKQEKFENGVAIVLRYLVGQGLWDALKNSNKSDMGENGVKKFSWT